MAPKLVTKIKEKAKGNFLTSIMVFNSHAKKYFDVTKVLYFYKSYFHIPFQELKKTLDANIAHISQVRSFAMLPLLTVGI